MATMTKAPEYYEIIQNGSFDTWKEYSPSLSLHGYRNDITYQTETPVFLVELPLPELSVSSVTVEAQFMNVWSQWNPGHLTSQSIRLELYSGGDVGNRTLLGSQEFVLNGDPSTMTPVSHRFNFSGLSAVVGAVHFEILAMTHRAEFEVSLVNASITYTAPSLELTLTPSTVYVDHSVNVQVLNRFDRPVTAEFWYSDTLLETKTITQDATSVLCPERWFTTAAFSGSSMRVEVRLSDDLGRTASGNFTLLKPEGSAATPIAPRSTRLDGTQAINFAWQTADTWGAQTKAELQWSLDNAAWTDLATVNGSGTAWTAPALTFPAGTIWWRVRATNEYFEVGPWSNGVSFTVEYSAQSQVEPVDTPTSGTINASVDRVFSVVLRASGAVYTPFTVAEATLYWRSGTGGAYTEAPMTPDGSRASCLIPAGTFPSGTIQWYAEATDNTGSTTETELYTLSTLSAAVEAVPLSPVNTVESGSGPITFRWFYGSVDAQPQGAAQLRVSYDGEEWTTLATVTDAGARSYTVPKNSFAAGTIWWQVRAKTVSGDYGPWSASASFVCYAAPLIEGVLADQAPFMTVTWQTEGQLAYEIDVDGAVYGPYFGAEVRSFTLPEPLEDGLHTARVRAQNKYGLWSEWSETAFITQNSGTQALTLSVEADVDAKLTWTGGSSVTPPVITVQPVDMQATEGLMSFSVDAAGAGLRYQWYKQEASASGWSEIPGTDKKVLTLDVTASLDGCHFHCIVSNAAGWIASSFVTFTYAAPTAAPEIRVQPVTVQKKTGTAEFLCGADGSAYQWYRRVVDTSGSESDVRVTDGAAGLWRIPYGGGEAGDQGVTDGPNRWHIPAGAGSAGDLAVTDGVSLWHMPAGAGTEEWEAIPGETGAVLSFPADIAMDGAQFYCRVYNELGRTDSDVVQFIYADEPGEALPGDYYVYRDGELIARRTEPAYTDRTALGTHSYRILNRLDNNHYLYSNSVTVTISVDTLMIAPLAGGAWQRLRLSDQASREFRYDRSRAVSYTHYSGSPYPEAEVGEEEELTGSFDAAWPHEMKAQADAFRALLGTAVVLKTPEDVVIVGVLEGYQRRDPLFYSAYTFTLRQMDWREIDDA